MQEMTLGILNDQASEVLQKEKKKKPAVDKLW